MAQCKKCKRGGLKWVETPQGWRLTEPNGNKHDCIVVRQSFQEKRRL